MKAKNFFNLLSTRSLLIAGAILSCFLAAQDNSQLDAAGNLTGSPTGFQEILLDFNGLSADDVKEDPLLRRLHPDYWLVELNDSSNYIPNQKVSFAKKVVGSSKVEGVFSGGGDTGSFLGIRSNFPNVHSNAYITVKPEYPVLAFTADPNNNPFKNKGFIDNVSEVKDISSFVFGANYPYDFFVQLRNEKGEVKKFYLGKVNYKGWRLLTYKNDSYLEDVRKRKLQGQMAYPYSSPYYEFDSYVFFRHAGEVSGDFITYVSWTKMTYDKFHATDDPSNEIDGESVWGIMRYRAMIQDEREKASVRYVEDLIDLERAKMNLPPLKRAIPGGAATTSGATTAAPATAPAPAAK